VPQQIYELEMESPVGWLGIRTDGSALTVLDILAHLPVSAGRPDPAGEPAGPATGSLRGLAPAPAPGAVPRPASAPAPELAPGPAARRAAAALTRYFEGDPSALTDLPVAPAGTPFQRRVWTRMSAIPAGAVLSYGAFARELGTSARAIGGACRANPIPIVIPCHRVVAAHGLGGYSGERGGDWLAKKRWLLAHEGVQT
jgi:methylated-DNA-[protein]-cysteine S-methyltransferase